VPLNETEEAAKGLLRRRADIVVWKLIVSEVSIQMCPDEAESLGRRSKNGEISMSPKKVESCVLDHLHGSEPVRSWSGAAAVARFGMNGACHSTRPCPDEAESLGRRSKNGEISMSPKKVDAILNYVRPTRIGARQIVERSSGGGEVRNERSVPLNETEEAAKGPPKRLTPSSTMSARRRRSPFAASSVSLSGTLRSFRSR
jgi:hypothetical protein